MSEIALYNALTKLGLKADEAKEAVADVTSSKEVATKTDIVRLEGFLKERLTKVETELKYLRWFIVVVVGIAAGIIKYL